ncbi:hypothetical protein [Ensifer aridi]|nr:hypothetical protein [Ensifer aridi]
MTKSRARSPDAPDYGWTLLSAKSGRKLRFKTLEGVASFLSREWQKDM